MWRNTDYFDLKACAIAIGAIAFLEPVRALLGHLKWHFRRVDAWLEVEQRGT